MSDIKLTDRINLNDIFGIISPGVFILIGLVLCIIGFIDVLGYNAGAVDYERVNAILKEWTILLGIIGFFASYLFGSVARLFANDFAEVVSGVYLRKIRRKRSALATERFPYPFAGASLKDANYEVYDWYRTQYAFFGQEDTLPPWNRKYFFNRCKASLYAVSPERAVFYERIESFVRFLAGALVSNMILFSITLPFGIYFVAQSRNLLAAIYLSLASFSLVTIVAILERFRNQHTREVMSLWTSYYDASRERERSSPTNRQEKLFHAAE